MYRLLFKCHFNSLRSLCRCLPYISDETFIYMSERKRVSPFSQSCFQAAGVHLSVPRFTVLLVWLSRDSMISFPNFDLSVRKDDYIQVILLCIICNQYLCLIIHELFSDVSNSDFVTLVALKTVKIIGKNMKGSGRGFV